MAGLHVVDVLREKRSGLDGVVSRLEQHLTRQPGAPGRDHAAVRF